MSDKRSKKGTGKTTASASGRSVKPNDPADLLFSDLRQMILESRGRVAQQINAD